MSIRDNCFNNGKRECSSVYTSSIIYDGENIDEAGVRNGDTLNNVIENLAKYLSRSISLAGAVRMESFKGTSSVRLQSKPAEILMVVYCGGVLPSHFYKVEGKTIKFCSDFCRGDDFSDVQVVYREKSDSSLGFTC